KHTEKIVTLVYKATPAQRPEYLARFFQAVLDGKKDFYSVLEIASGLGWHPQTVRNHIMKKKLLAINRGLGYPIMVHRHWLISWLRARVPMTEPTRSAFVREE